MAAKCGEKFKFPRQMGIYGEEIDFVDKWYSVYEIIFPHQRAKIWRGNENEFFLAKGHPFGYKINVPRQKAKIGDKTTIPRQKAQA